MWADPGKGGHGLRAERLIGKALDATFYRGAHVSSESQVGAQDGADQAEGGQGPPGSHREQRTLTR